MTAIFSLPGTLTIPLAFLNVIGGIIAGIWLAVLGEWSVIGWGILFLGVSTFGIGIAMIPGLIFAIPTTYFGKRGHMLPMGFFALLHNLIHRGHHDRVVCVRSRLLHEQRKLLAL